MKKNQKQNRKIKVKTHTLRTRKQDLNSKTKIPVQADMKKLARKLGIAEESKSDPEQAINTVRTCKSNSEDDYVNIIVNSFIEPLPGCGSSIDKLMASESYQGKDSGIQSQESVKSENNQFESKNMEGDQPLIDSNQTQNNETGHKAPRLRRRKRQIASLLSQQEGLVVQQNGTTNLEQNGRSRRQVIKRPDLYQSDYCHHCGKLESCDNLVKCKHDLCGLKFCFQDLRQHYYKGTVKTKLDLQDLRREGMVCPVCTEKCRCSNCKSANLNVDIQKLRREMSAATIPPSNQNVPSVTRTLTFEVVKVPSAHEKEKVSSSISTKISIPVFSYKNKGSSDQIKVPIAQTQSSNDSNNIVNDSKSSQPNLQSDSTFKNTIQPQKPISSKVFKVEGEPLKLTQFKLHTLANPLEYLSHQFTEMKYISETKCADFRGLITESDENDEDGTFDYDRKKLGLTLDKEKDITQERVSHNETLKSLEVHALQAFYGENKIMINGFEISERPEISMTKCYDVDPAIWGFNLNEAGDKGQMYMSNPYSSNEQTLNGSRNNTFSGITKGGNSHVFNISKQADQQLNFANKISISSTQKLEAARVMEIGMEPQLVGSKRNRQNASQVKIIPIAAGSEEQLEPTLKRQKTSADQSQEKFLYDEKSKGPQLSDPIKISMEKSSITDPLEQSKQLILQELAQALPLPLQRNEKGQVPASKQLLFQGLTHALPLPKSEKTSVDVPFSQPSFPNKNVQESIAELKPLGKAPYEESKVFKSSNKNENDEILPGTKQNQTIYKNTPDSVPPQKDKEEVKGEEIIPKTKSNAQNQNPVVVVKQPIEQQAQEQPMIQYFYATPYGIIPTTAAQAEQFLQNTNQTYYQQYSYPMSQQVQMAPTPQEKTEQSSRLQQPIAVKANTPENQQFDMSQMYQPTHSIIGYVQAPKGQLIPAAISTNPSYISTQPQDQFWPPYSFYQPAGVQPSQMQPGMYGAQAQQMSQMIPSVQMSSMNPLQGYMMPQAQTSTNEPQYFYNAYQYAQPQAIQGYQPMQIQNNEIPQSLLVPQQQQQIPPGNEGLQAQMRQEEDANQQAFVQQQQQAQCLQNGIYPPSGQIALMYVPQYKAMMAAPSQFDSTQLQQEGQQKRWNEQQMLQVIPEPNTQVKQQQEQQQQQQQQQLQQQQQYQYQYVPKQNYDGYQMQECNHIHGPTQEQQKYNQCDYSMISQSNQIKSNQPFNNNNQQPPPPPYQEVHSVCKHCHKSKTSYSHTVGESQSKCNRKDSNQQQNYCRQDMVPNDYKTIKININTIASQNLYQTQVNTAPQTTYQNIIQSSNHQNFQQNINPSPSQPSQQQQQQQQHPMQEQQQFSQNPEQVIPNNMISQTQEQKANTFLQSQLSEDKKPIGNTIFSRVSGVLLGGKQQVNSDYNNILDNKVNNQMSKDIQDDNQMRSRITSQSHTSELFSRIQPCMIGNTLVKQGQTNLQQSFPKSQIVIQAINDKEQQVIPLSQCNFQFVQGQNEVQLNSQEGYQQQQQQLVQTNLERAIIEQQVNPIGQRMNNNNLVQQDKSHYQKEEAKQSECVNPMQILAQMGFQNDSQYKDMGQACLIQENAIADQFTTTQQFFQLQESQQQQHQVAQNPVKGTSQCLGFNAETIKSLDCKIQEITGLDLDNQLANLQEGFKGLMDSQHTILQNSQMPVQYFQNQTQMIDPVSGNMGMFHNVQNQQQFNQNGGQFQQQQFYR